MNKLFAFMILAFSFTACQQQPTGEERKSTVEKELEQTGLQNVAEEIPGIEVYMVYATPYNFMGRVLYTGLDEAYLVPEAIEKLRKSNELLRKKRLDLHLVVYDAAAHVQFKSKCGRWWRIPSFKTMWPTPTRVVEALIIMV